MTGPLAERRPAWLGAKWFPDLAVVAVVGIVVILGTVHIDQEDAARAPDTVALVCGVVAAAALAVWRRYTLVMLGVVGGAVFVYLVRGYPGGPALLPGPIALGYVGYRVSRPMVWWLGGAFAVLLVVGQWIGENDLGVAGIIGIGWVIAALFGGQVVAARNERVAAQRERIEHAQQQAVADERLRIAHDLHDSVAHAMATISVQAGVAGHLLDRRPEQARSALEAIRQASNDVLDELGAILATLRRDEVAAPRAPVAGLDRLGDLIERSRADGLEVTCRVEGDVATVAAPLSTAAYRVVQEALSNTRRHAGVDAAASVVVSIAAPGALVVDVADDGGRRVNSSPSGPRPTGLGLGLAGMRERVESTGGSLANGPREPHGFRVVATWPAHTRGGSP